MSLSDGLELFVNVVKWLVSPRGPNMVGQKHFHLQRALINIYYFFLRINLRLLTGTLKCIFCLLYKGLSYLYSRHLDFLYNYILHFVHFSSNIFLILPV